MADSSHPPLQVWLASLIRPHNPHARSKRCLLICLEFEWRLQHVLRVSITGIRKCYAGNNLNLKSTYQLASLKSMFGILQDHNDYFFRQKRFSSIIFYLSYVNISSCAYDGLQISPQILKSRRKIVHGFCLVL